MRSQGKYFKVDYDVLTQGRLLPKGDLTMHAWTLTHGVSQSKVKCYWVSMHCIRFCLKLGHLSTENIWMIKKAFEGNSMNGAWVKF